MAAAAMLLGACGDSSSSSSSSTTQPSGFAGCLTTNTIGANVPTWISNNFICVNISSDGTTVDLFTTDQPPYYDFYWPTTHDYYSTAGRPATEIPNEITDQSVVFMFPNAPVFSGSTINIPAGAAGVSIHGVLLFNNEAASPDILVDEVDTMDTNNMGHPTGGGFYHHHTEPLQISNNDSALIGVALDGFPIYGRQEEDGSIAFTGESVTNNYHSHAVDTANLYGFNGAVTIHYHVVDSDFETTTDGVVTEVPWMFGPTTQYFAGTLGTVTGGP